MPSFSGKFAYKSDSGACTIAFDTESCTVTPAAGAPIAFDLGDIDRITPGEWEMSLALYTGNSIVLKQFGTVFSRMQEELLAAWRDRTVQCLLLEDLEEVERYDAAANGARAQIRLYGSNLAALPIAADPTQVRLADVDSVAFDGRDGAARDFQAGEENRGLSREARRGSRRPAKSDRGGPP
jgi:hypothetical protein